MPRRSRVHLALSLVSLLLAGAAGAQTTTTEPKAEVPKPPAPGSPFQIKVGDANVRFGILLQPQADWSQDAASGGYSQNLMLRRMRFLMGGQVTKDVFFFFETDNARLGRGTATGKDIATGFQVLDAIAEWRPMKEFNLQAGLLRVPSSREALKSSGSEFALDFSAYAFTSSSALAATGGNRDTGFMVRGFFLADRLEYRVSAVQGLREAGSRNSFRTTARLQYNVFDTELYTFPSYAGSYLGSKRILALGAAIDTQMHYTGYTADAYFDWPIPVGSVEGTLEWQRLDFGATLPAQGKSNIVQGEAGVYIKGANLGPWARYEQRKYVYPAGKDEKRWQVGLNYYIAKHTFNIKAGYGRVNPDVGNSTNQFTLQLQAYYF